MKIKALILLFMMATMMANIGNCDENSFTKIILLTKSKKGEVSLFNYKLKMILKDHFNSNIIFHIDSNYNEIINHIAIDNEDYVKKFLLQNEADVLLYQRKLKSGIISLEGWNAIGEKIVEYIPNAENLSNEILDDITVSSYLSFINIIQKNNTELLYNNRIY